MALGVPILKHFRVVGFVTYTTTLKRSVVKSWRCWDMVQKVVILNRHTASW